MSECIATSYVVYQQSAGCTSVKLCGDTLELLLAGSVVYLELDIPLLASVFLAMVFNFDHSRSEVNSDCQVVLRSEAFIHELHEEARFADRGISNNDVLEEKRVRHVYS